MRQIAAIVIFLIIFLVVFLGVANWCHAADPNTALTDEIRIGFKFWLRPSGIDSMTHFVFRPDDANLPLKVWESADIVPGNWYSTFLPAGKLEWWTVKTKSWFNLLWLSRVKLDPNS